MHNKTPDDKKLSGLMGEMVAATYLENRGYKILEKNYTSGYGEIDLIVMQDYDLVFVEVKLRREGLSAAYSSISANKKKKLIRTALCFLQQNPLYDKCLCRFDVIAVVQCSHTENFHINHLENAFSTDEVDYQLWRD